MWLLISESEVNCLIKGGSVPFCWERRASGYVEEIKVMKESTALFCDGEEEEEGATASCDEGRGGGGGGESVVVTTRHDHGHRIVRVN